MTARVLFLTKRKEDYNALTDRSVGLTTGLYNSAGFVRDMLVGAGFDTDLRVVVDNNQIDREVTQYRPTHVIVEALWVVPSKFAVLQKLHPGVTWVVRLHSELPFLANEGVAMDWLGEYANLINVVIACNSTRMTRELQALIEIIQGWTPERARGKVIHLPNYYPPGRRRTRRPDRANRILHVACFGAVRPMKNHLIQAMAAIEAADQLNKRLHFHINAGRIENRGDPVLANLRGLFQHVRRDGHELISHDWAPHEQFLELCRSMDVGMQVSLSETFNIVSADLITSGVPMVNTHEIPWALDKFNADPTNSEEIRDKLLAAYHSPRINTWLNHVGLVKYSRGSRSLWISYLRRDRNGPRKDPSS